MTESSDPVEPGGALSSPSGRSGWKDRVTRQRQQLEVHKERATAEFADRRERHRPVQVAIAIYERDRDAFGSVLGSAIAMRLFLFMASLSVAVVGLVNLVTRGKGFSSALATAGITGQVASQVDGASQGSSGRHITFLLTGLFLSASAGRSLTRVLAASSAGAWGMVASGAKATMRTAARVTSLVALIVVTASLLNRARASFGLAVGTSSLAANAVAMGLGWFFVSLALPRTSRDPSAVLPGAALFGVVMTLVQAFMQWYLPGRIANASETMGALGFTVATLGYLFLIGRVMAGSLVVNAVLWEEVGSLAEAAFSLPVLRKLPDRSPRLVAFLGLAPRPGAEAAVDDPVGAPVREAGPER